MKIQLTVGVVLVIVLSACATPEAVLLKVDPVTLRPLAHVRVSVGAAKVAGSAEYAGMQVIVPFVDQDPLIFESSTDERSPRTVTWRLPAVLAVQHGLRFPEVGAIGGIRFGFNDSLVQVKELEKFKDLEKAKELDAAKGVAAVGSADEKALFRSKPDTKQSVLADCRTADDGLSVTCAVRATRKLIFSYEIRVQQGDKVFILDPTGMIN